MSNLALSKHRNRCCPCWLVALAWLLAGAAGNVRADPPTDSPDAIGPGYEYYAVGDVTAPTPGTVGPGLALLGGGDWPLEAMHWFVHQAGGGHIVVLRARGGRELQTEIFNEVGGVASVETLVIHDEDAARDPKLLAIVARADGVFIGGGDQSNYIRLWKDTPLSHLIDAKAAAGRPVGGTSAGLAVLGGYAYGCLDSISLTSKDALANPTGAGVTLVRDFLHLPYLKHVITDSHFAIRDRLGRLVTFVGRLAQEENDASITGLGIDEGTALIIDGDGIGRFYTTGAGYAWLVRPARKPAVIVAGQPLSYRRFTVVGIDPRSTIDLKTYAVTDPAFRRPVAVRHGVLAAGDGHP